MWDEIGIAFSLMLVIEGIIPFLYPGRWRKLVATLAEISDSSLRLIGLGSMITGIALLYFIN
ncbi:DUF2065 domain-containing protein [Gammaproteobacteria bacterium]|jgi:uncharacterized protein YjeT (DUF2065 family)|nr:DUF2065 domain-containing protein [Gammaproteobacteria bacterium]MBT6042846.1 DUF2065 domain-containing protein [Gammaproteobacteria bacterium]MDA9909865.1 DUF2065 domain-containing protein [Gammaproteobacteria bacterium]